MAIGGWVNQSAIIMQSHLELETPKINRFWSETFSIKHNKAKNK
jgi:hypothetical protein